MKPKKTIRIKQCIALLCALLLGTFSFTAQAAELSDLERQQLETQQQLEDAQAKRRQAQEAVDSLQGEADSLNSVYQSYAGRLAAINSEIDNAQAAMASTSEELETLAAELAQAREDEKSQRELMKVHIQYMYEHQAGQSMIMFLFDSDSMANFVKRVEYTHAIMENDANLIQAYTDLQATIAGKSRTLSAKQEELRGYQDTLTAKQEELDALTTDAKEEYTAKTGEVSVAQMSVEEYEDRLAELSNRLESLRAEQAAAQAALAQQIAEQEAAAQPESGTGEGDAQNGEAIVPPADNPADREYTAQAYNASDYEIRFLAATIQAEADNQGTEGQLAVGSVIMNRVFSSKFPGQNTIEAVIKQPKQFESYAIGMVDLIMERGPNESCMNAARQVVRGYRSGDWLFFMTKYWADHFGITGYTVIRDHVFFYKWGAN